MTDKEEFKRLMSYLHPEYTDEELKKLLQHQSLSKIYGAKGLQAIMTEEDEVPQYPLYHGIRTNKTSDQIKKEGFCTFKSKIDMKKEIVLALKHFGKERLLTVKGGDGYKIRRYLEQSADNFRKNIWASTDKDAACEWWAHANPEIISWMLHDIDISPEKIDKYLSERFGNRCYNIKLKLTSRGTSADFNTGLDCIPPNLIDLIEECEECKYTLQSKSTIKKSK